MWGKARLLNAAISISRDSPALCWPVGPPLRGHDGEELPYDLSLSESERVSLGGRVPLCPAGSGEAMPWHLRLIRESLSLPAPRLVGHIRS